MAPDLPGGDIASPHEMPTMSPRGKRRVACDAPSPRDLQPNDDGRPEFIHASVRVSSAQSRKEYAQWR